MKENFFRSMTWLHTWTGLLVCWLLFLIFFAGTLSFFRHEITLWAQPAAHDVQPQLNRVAAQRQQISTALEHLAMKAPEAETWWVGLPNERNHTMAVSYREKGDDGVRGKWQDNYMDPNSQSILAEYRDTKGGHFFYRLHFDLHYMDRTVARWIVSFASLFMLIGLISGVVIHKRIFKDMFQFRSAKGVRTWLDAHNLSSVLALPFHIMITYTGLVTLIFMLFPYPAMTQYEGGNRAFFADLNSARQHADATGKQVEMLPMKQLVDQFYTNWPNVDIKRVILDHPFDETAIVKFYANTGTQVQDEMPVWVYSAVTGELKTSANTDLSPSETLYDGMIALHTGRLALPGLRWLYFICGIAGCVMIASGAVMWAKRIRARMKSNEQPGLGLKLVEALNLATLMGLPVATTAFFYANRLLPNDLSNRADMEVHLFFVTWLCVTVFAIYRAGTKQWKQLAQLNVILWLLLPICNALTTQGNLISYLLEQQWILAGFDLLCILTAFGFFIQMNKLATQEKANVVGTFKLKERNT
ncbi:PepSY-associated TM helix domain-containing protein [Pseudoalteromonas sp. MMG005]|uniref:PepSY-associated TM helix domain-containing protein n=1 Tax=Pseudoalteromonas sp. MMG005 TaxID=2822682 RepID=UPI001B3A2CEA|nr:PepSY-associated TM helix domain-containing protein [Pseudoalteromonas sp. MMG005]MBQ4846758.1 PepSY domain-containing protein [Pseudoalteromonas sp. MMG005]